MKEGGENKSKRKGREIDSPGLELVHVGVHKQPLDRGLVILSAAFQLHEKSKKCYPTA